MVITHTLSHLSINPMHASVHTLQIIIIITTGEIDRVGADGIVRLLRQSDSQLFAG